MVKGANTINEYKILKWVDENFYRGSVSVKMIDDATAEITDSNNDTLKISVVSGSVEVLF